ncbi:HlyD family secretion protein [Cellvibrio sp.]|uniref:HlyD family secretion protein n=1 Tax=Cellvibrio sp. TaxID=1965322 RepID=UPI0039648952
MLKNLFRQEAIDAKHYGLKGDVLMLPRFSHSLILAILLLWFSIVIIWLFCSHYARKQTVVGWLEPPEGIIRIYAESTGIVRKILVKEGEFVKQDQPLLIIGDEHTLITGDDLDKGLLDEYSSQQKMLSEQLLRTQSNFEMRIRDVEKRIASSYQDLRLIDEQLDILNNRYALVVAQVERFRRLKREGFLANTELDGVVAQELSLKNDRQALLRNKVAQTNLIAQLQTEQKLLPGESANALDQLRSRLSDIAQQVKQLSGRGSRVIKAPREGVVNNLQARQGQQVYANNNIPLLKLFPDSKQLTAHLLVPVRSIGFIEAGQPLAIRYDAFPYQKFGIYQGRVELVSKTLLLPNELLNTPLQVNEPVYRVTALLSASGVRAYGKDFPLKPGMTLSADIGLGDRSLIQWLLEPVYSLKGRI